MYRRRKRAKIWRRSLLYCLFPFHQHAASSRASAEPVEDARTVQIALDHLLKASSSSGIYNKCPVTKENKK